MRKFYLIIFSLVFALCIGSSNNVQGQNTDDSFIFDADDIIASGGGHFNYSNQNTSIFGRLRDGNFGPQQCNCVAGGTLNLRGLYSGNSILGTYPGLVNGNLYKQVFYSGTLVFDGGSYVLPMRYNRSRFNVTLPATLTGSLTGYASSAFNQNPPPIFTKQFSLQGTVTVSLQVIRLLETTSGAIPYYKIHLVKYNFPRTSQNMPENKENSDYQNELPNESKSQK